MLPDNRFYDLQGRPFISLKNTHDIDTAQHFLADHAAELIVAFDHHAMDPDVSIYVATPEGKLSAGDFYLWPLLHQTARRIDAELAEKRRKGEGSWRWHYYRRGLDKWSKRMPRLHTLIRIRKSTVHALCDWDLQGRRPKDLVVLDAGRTLAGLTRKQAQEVTNEN